MRKRFIAGLARLLRTEIYFELVPMVEDEFDKLERDFAAFPVYYHWSKLQESLWPRPDRRYRVFVQPLH